MPKTLQMVCAVALAIIFTTGATLAQTAPMAGTPMPMASGMHPPATPKPCATKQNGCKKKNKKKAEATAKTNAECRRVADADGADDPAPGAIAAAVG
jgi:hypothetical protein